MRRAWLILIAVAFSLPLYIGVGRADLRGDEAGHSFSVDRILEIGDWLAPKSSPSEDAVFLEKPPLKFWLVAAPIKLGLLPHDEFGLRFWDPLFAGIAFLYVFALGSELAGPMCGAVAVLILFIHRPLLFEHGVRTNNMEAAVLLCYCGGIFHFLRWMKSPPSRRRGHALAVGVYFVLGFMTKFVAALFMPLVLAVTAVLFKEWRTKLFGGIRHWIGAALLAAALIAPWFLYCQIRFGRELWDTMFGAHVYTRFTSYLDPAHVQPWHFYFSTMFENLVLSGSAVLVIAGFVALLVQTVWRRWPEGALILIWFGLPLSLISAGTSKLYHYAYPFLPPMALAGGYIAGLVSLLGPPLVARGLRRVGDAWTGAYPRLHRSLSRPGLQTAFGLIAVVAAVLALTNVFYGPVRIAIGNVSLFKSSGVVRPSVVLVLAGLAIREYRRVARVLVLLLVLGQLPMDAYRQVFALLNTGEHPMRSARDCVLAVQQPGVTPGLYVDGLGHGFSHEHYYYFRKIRPWEVADAPSPARLYQHLYVEHQSRPMLVLESIYRDVLHGAGRTDDSQPPASSVPLASFTDVVMLMPPPYTSCSPANAGGTPEARK